MNVHVILVYDINTEDNAGKKRLPKVLKICRKYLVHVQKSVFEGHLTEGQYTRLQHELGRVVDKKADFVIAYKLGDGVKLEKDILTETPDPTDNFL
ncbi:CRISPR-associated endonuclease Cas2 [Desulfofundulus kuznetsovii]|uniref:CRISPR-associated endonuclease Cas2 n=1 Tax=Desulfofundulus kuznetsovii TaxID=58135 RepID=UPI00338F6E6A